MHFLGELSVVLLATIGLIVVLAHGYDKLSYEAQKHLEDALDWYPVLIIAGAVAALVFIIRAALQ
ncbi:MAG: hypothetical protein P8164_11660 [Gammaproteobacteria bacterium]